MRKNSIPLAKQEFTPTYESLLLHTEIQKDVLKCLCKQIQNFKEFNGENYYTSLSQIKDFIEKQEIAFDVVAELQEKSVNPKHFLDYVIEAKANYPLFKLTANQDELNKYFATLSPDTDTWKQLKEYGNMKVLTNYSHTYIVDTLTNLTKDNIYKFDEFLNDIESQIPTATTNNFKLYFDVYKILSKEKPLKVQLDLTERQSIWNVLAGKPNTPEYIEIVAIQISSGINTGGTLGNEQIKYLAENLDYYANYGELLVNNISWNIPILNQALKYITENKLGYILSLENVLPNFFNILTNIGVSESVLLKQFNDWENHKGSITKDNIHSIFQNIPQFFQFSVATTNALTDYLNTTIIEALSAIPTDTLYQQKQQPNYFWNTIIENLIDTDFLKPLPDNLTELGKKLLDDIAASQLATPNANDITHKLIEKLDRSKTKETITNIRNQVCNNVASYNIDANKFLFLHEWFEKQGDLQSRSGDVCQYILSPVANNDNCLKVIVENADFYTTIINLADTQADTFKNSIRTKLSKSADEALIAFAKKIGIEEEK